MNPIKSHNTIKSIDFVVNILITVMLLSACGPVQPPPPTVPPPTAHNPKFRMCAVGPLSAPSGASAPQVNGEVGGDLGWFGATRYVFKNNGSSSPTSDVAMQAKHDSSNLYLSFEIGGD